MKNTEQALVPKLRFPEFRDKGVWKESTISELIAIIPPPKKLNTTQYLSSGQYPIVDQSPDKQCGWTNDSDDLFLHTEISKKAVCPRSRWDKGF
jgi:type I restriction enzyme S subunit